MKTRRHTRLQPNFVMVENTMAVSEITTPLTMRRQWAAQ